MPEQHANGKTKDCVVIRGGTVIGIKRLIWLD